MEDAVPMDDDQGEINKLEGVLFMEEFSKELLALLCIRINDLELFKSSVF